MTDRDRETFEQLGRYTRETALLRSIESLLGWDERTHLPPAAGPYRADQLALLSGQIHQRSTSPRVGQWLDELAQSPLVEDPHGDAGATVRELRREYEKKRKLPAELVTELTRASVLGQQSWSAARKNDDFASFRPHLQRIFQLKREEAQAIGFETCPYDVLLDDYEPDGKTEQLKEVFASLRRKLTPLVSEIAQADRRPDPSILSRRYEVAAQESFARQAAERIGFDFARGRLDVTDHPFCETTGPNDCRITTRFDERHFSTSFFGVLHEAGHGIYEQGLRQDQYGLPPGEAASLGVHESQSRLWENFVGRGLPFWKHFFPLARRAFPEALSDVSLDRFHAAINDVRPSLIRVEADEATYNLHIIIRFELEQALLNEELSVDDLPVAWNEKYREYLGIAPPNDADGVLQDIHWSAGLIGYFPTYTLGNLYAAQLFAAADRELGDLDEQLGRGEFGSLLDWLRRNVQRHGRCYSAAELVRRAVGGPLDDQPLIDYLHGRLAPIFGLDKA